MKFNINQAELNNALTIVGKGTPSGNNTTLPILTGVYLKATGSMLILQTTDLELSIKVEVPALVEEEGEIVIPAKLLQDIVKNLPDMAVSFETEESTISILCNNASYSLKTLNALDFPSFPEIEPEQEAQFPFRVFSSMVKSTAKAISKDDSRAVLTGVLVAQEETTLRMVATDSYRLALSETKLDSVASQEFEVIIKGAFLQSIAALPASDNMISLGINENQIIVTYNNTTFINRRIEGTFPNYKQLLAGECTTKVILPVRDVAQAVKRVSLLYDKTYPVQIFVDVDARTVTFAAHSQDVGNAQETLIGEFEGESVDVAFNFTFMLDGLNSISSDTVELDLFGGMKPGILRSTDSEENFLYLIMPVRI